VIDASDLARVKRGLSVENPVALTGGLRFHADAESGLITEYVQVPDAPFAGGGLDIVGLIKAGIGKWQSARRDAEAREARALIVQQLLAMHAWPPPPPEGLIYPPFSNRP